MIEKPNPEDINNPWEIVDCNGIQGCNSCSICDGHGWYYRNKDTGDTISEMMRSAMERHF